MYKQNISRIFLQNSPPFHVFLTFGNIFIPSYLFCFPLQRKEKKSYLPSAEDQSSRIDLKRHMNNELCLESMWFQFCRENFFGLRDIYLFLTAYIHSTFPLFFPIKFTLEGDFQKTRETQISY